ncbi:hypothetical protein CA13_40310 [Planctomycetes bacterium CA13]|uniref:Uncharacterized protein n=1 Tax=Novipirellula herctigrandis TaxID=2527986 RepID=A0A5C5Z5I3_9BACT|nr:hypothetical protein CA13_40310 [Planctomycetes bacterium CA13]
MPKTACLIQEFFDYNEGLFVDHVFNALFPKAVLCLYLAIYQAYCFF